MDLVHEKASIVADEEDDKISKLPDDIIHRILSFLDMKYAVQTSAVSRKWKYIWTSMPYLNLDSELFPKLPHFSEFVKQALAHRNDHTNVSAVDLKFTGLATEFGIKSIVNYAYFHNIRKMTIVWYTKNWHEFPQFLFTSQSHTLKHLSIAVKHPNPPLLGVLGNCKLPDSSWDFPALETLYLSGLALGHYDSYKKNNFFTKCVNLKDLTLHKCSMFYMKIINVCCPKLSNLTIKDVAAFPEVLKVVAPKLENLTASISARCGFSSNDFLQLSLEDLVSLEKVNLSKSNENFFKKRNFPRLLDLLQKLSSAKFLILDMDIIQTLSSDLDQLSREPCPFYNLKCLKINTSRLQHTDPMPTIPTQIRNYFLENSPNATFIIDSVQVSWNRPRQELHEDTLANKVAELEEKLQNREEVIVEQKEKIQTLEAAKLQHENFMSRLMKSKMEGLKVQVERGNPDYEVIRSVRRNIKSVMDLVPESLRVDIEAQFSSQYKELKSLLLTCIDPSQWVKIEKELEIKGDSERTFCNNTGVQSDVSVAALPQALSPLSTNPRPRLVRKQHLPHSGSIDK